MEVAKENQERGHILLHMKVEDGGAHLHLVVTNIAMTVTDATDRLIPHMMTIIEGSDFPLLDTIIRLSQCLLNFLLGDQFLSVKTIDIGEEEEIIEVLHPLRMDAGRTEIIDLIHLHHLFHILHMMIIIDEDLLQEIGKETEKEIEKD